MRERGRVGKRDERKGGEIGMGRHAESETSGVCVRMGLRSWEG